MAVRVVMCTGGPTIYWECWVTCDPLINKGNINSVEPDA